MIEHAAHKIERLTSSLMFVARPKPQRITCFAPEKTLDKAAEFLLAMGQTKHLSIVRDYSSGGALVECDENQIEQVCMNLIVNAAHAVDAAPDKCITLRTRSDYGRGLVTISVSDTGCGIDGSIRDRIFEPFFTTKPAGRGNGLGLAVVKQIVERNAGFVSVQSTPGAGSTFTVAFPLKTVSGVQRDVNNPGRFLHDEAVIQEKSA
jgi:signal transduction histidine kinase